MVGKSSKMKNCPRCKTLKSVDNFHKRNDRKSGLASYCKQCVSKDKDAYYQKNSDIIKDKRKRYRRNNRKKTNTQQTNYQRKKRHKDVGYKILSLFRQRLLSVIKKCSGIKCDKSLNLLGCTLKQFKTHLESQFQEGMNWNNHGVYKFGDSMKWHVDHIKPCALFDFTKAEDQKACFHYTNLQPLWAIDNIKKGKILIK
jgi:hypothetical protein